MENKKFDFKSMTFKDIPAFIIAKIKGGAASDEVLTGQTGKYEVNLVPAAKLNMIKMQKIRNLVFFICIVVSIASGATVAVLGSVQVGQAVTMAVQKGHMEKLNRTVLDYDELSEFLTIQDQLSKIKSIEDNKKVLSRVFSILSTLLPKGKDSVTLSELNVNLQNSTLSFDAQADAGEEPFIDYRVLESFKKSVNMMKYDHGRYVDAEGREIPTRCIQETDANGNMYSENGAIFAIWKRGETGCDPSRDDYKVDDDGNISTKNFTNQNVSSSLDNTDFTGSNEGIGSISGGNNSNKANTANTTNKKDDDRKDDETVVAADKKVVDVVPNEKIWRTPQFTDWYNGKRVMTAEDGIEDDIAAEGENNTIRNIISYVYTPSMALSGAIDGVPHFESACISYSGEEANGTVKWSAENICKMTSEDISISDSSNGRDSDDNLVLRFSAVITLDSQVFAYQNKHMMVITPSGQNVTDSYVQIEGMFAAPATDCGANDTACKDTTNITGE